MKVGFYIPGYEHLGIEYLSACLKRAGHETAGFFDPLLCKDGFLHTAWTERAFDMEDWLIEQVVKSDIDLLAFSVVTGNFLRACRFAAKVRQRRPIQTVFGGIHCSSAPAQVIERDEVDYLVLGEGEEALVELADALEAGRDPSDIANLWFNRENTRVANPPRPTIEDLDALPFPDKDVFYDAAPTFLRLHHKVMASRGCPNSCAYCNNSRMRQLYDGKGRWRRRRSVDNVLTELAEARKRFEYKDVRFWDEIFLDDRDWLEEFAEKYPEAIGKPYYCWGHPRFIDEDIVALLEASGCQELNIGVETVNETTRRELLNRHETNEDIARSIELVRPTRIFLTTGNIINLPGQSLREVVEMAAFYTEHPVDLPWVYYFRYYPNTGIVQKARERGLLSDEEVQRIENPEDMQETLVHSTERDAIGFRRLRNLILLTAVAPKGLLRYLLRHERWRRFPAWNIQPFVSVLSSYYRRLVRGKKVAIESWPPLRQFQAMALYGFRKAAAWLARTGSG